MAGGSRITSLNGERIGHHGGVSCMAEYAVVDRGSVVVVDKDVPLADAALFGCAVMTGVGAVINTARIRPGDSVAVLGLGGVGLSGVLGARLAGAETIIAIDREPAQAGGRAERRRDARGLRARCRLRRAGARAHAAAASTMPSSCRAAPMRWPRPTASSSTAAPW